MDGLLNGLVVPDYESQDYAWREQAVQRTLKTKIGCVGLGLHSGRRIHLTLHPAPADHGIVFHRTDLRRLIPARHDNVTNTRLCTVLADPADPEIRVGTVEHVVAALAGCGIDNALIDVDGPEVPILDGSAASFVFLIDCAGSVAQGAPRACIEIREPVRVEEGDAFVELRPLAAPTGPGMLEMSLSIAFSAAAIGAQSLSLHLTEDSFRQHLARARTFAQAAEVAQLQQAGLALGGSLDNAIVVDGARVLNPGGLRMPDEFVRHKLLDAVGDLALAGAPIRGRFIGYRSGHALNNRLLRALFADPGHSRRTTMALDWASAVAQAA
jgi:UDP-3-O-[3-hydroxymyristoyl] N-acetylglucosamine deacetylase